MLKMSPSADGVERLKDSDTYLAGLERKLNRLSRKAANEVTRRDVIDSLVGARSVANHDLLNSGEIFIKKKD